jgi:hypothetical protein
MVSQVIPTKPADNELANKLDFRNNLAFIKAEIEALQAQDTAFLSLFGLTANAALFPAIVGENLPNDPASFTTLVQALDAGIEAGGGGGGGPVTLGAITDILTPSTEQRRAWQAATDMPLLEANFTFNLNDHAGLPLVFSTALQPITMTLPPASALNARQDGFLCSVSMTSGVNFGQIIGPTNGLRWQSGFFGQGVTHTSLFVGYSLSSGFRAWVDIYKDGGLYQLRGQVRPNEADDLTRYSPGSIPGTAMAAGSLVAGYFPPELDLGGTRAVGGVLEVEDPITGTHTLAQANTGKSLIYTGAGNTWNVPILLAGTRITIENEGSGSITFNILSSQPVNGGLVLPPGGTCRVAWIEALTERRVKITGTP